MTSFAKQAFHGAVVIILLGIVSNFLAYILRMILARSLPKEDFGLFYAVVAVVGVLYIATHLGLNDALTRHIAASRVKGDVSSIKAAILAVMYIEIALAVIAMAAIAAAAPFFAQKYFHHPLAVTVIIVQSLGMIMLPFETLYFSIFQGYQKMGWLGSINVIRMTFVVLFTLLYLWLGLGVLSPALGYLSWYFVAIAIYSPIIGRSVLPGFFSIPYHISWGLVRNLLAFGIPIIFSSMAVVIISYTDTIMLTALRGSLEEVAVYNVALPTASIIWFFSAGLAIVLFPVTSELWERKYHSHLQDGIRLVYRYALIFITPLALALATFPEFVLSTFFGPGFESGSTVLRILSIGAILFTFGRVNEAFFSGIGDPKQNSRIVWTGALVNLALNILLIPHFGMIGAASATVTSFFIIFLMGLIGLKKRVSFSIPWLSWIKVAFAGTLFMTALLWLKAVLPLPVWPKVILGTLASFVIYAAVLLLTKAVTIQEIKTQISRVL